MPLAIGLRPGGKFYLNDTEVVAEAFEGWSTAVLRLNGKTVRVTDEAATEIMPHVKVSCGRPSEGHLDKYKHMIERVKHELAARQRALDDGKLTQEEFDGLPAMEVPYEYLPRLIIEAPKNVIILREELYRRQKERK